MSRLLLLLRDCLGIAWQAVSIMHLFFVYSVILIIIFITIIMITIIIPYFSVLLSSFFINPCVSYHFFFLFMPPCHWGWWSE